MSEICRVLNNDGVFLFREPIVSMGDWRENRHGLTKNERGIPIKVLKRIIKENHFEIIAENYCFTLTTPLNKIFRKFSKNPIYYYKFYILLDKLISKFLHPKTELDFHLAMLELIVSIDDSHAGLYTELMTDFFGEYMMPAYCEVIEDKVVITRFFNEAFAKKDDLRIGDVITKIDCKSFEDIFFNS
jgi:hypothetical protein